jgi:uncharacterized protein (DUF983 family)
MLQKREQAHKCGSNEEENKSKNYAVYFVLSFRNYTVSWTFELRVQFYLQKWLNMGLWMQGMEVMT